MTAVHKEGIPEPISKLSSAIISARMTGWSEFFGRRLVGGDWNAHGRRLHK
jgi:hypothetical protein